ncbi:hypothetical protein BU17DRAFT_78612 [Hysterangium stoloniferum]|nr:hypothetical protein BU17DRAFT_78612 [Hysterangium stoloniferum]
MSPSPSSPPSELEGSPSSQVLEVVDSEAATSVPAPSPFNQTTTNLLRLGSLTMDKFSQDPSEELDGFDIPLVDPANPNSSAYYSGDKTMGGLDDDEPQIPNISPTESVRYLRDLTQRVFGITKHESLKFDIIEELGGNRMSCILTITRPNGVSRSYRTKPEFSRRTEAKVAAATSAIKLGCVNFIKNGDESGRPKRGILLAKLDAGSKKEEGDGAAGNPDPANGESGATTIPDTAVVDLENACTEWRAGTVSPQWVYFHEPKVTNAYGCAVKISLSPHIQRTYSVLISNEYHKKSLAKAACAKLAIVQGALDFIKHGDGLERPVIAPMGVALNPDPSPFPISNSAMTSQAFYASLPKPMPEQIPIKANGEINGLGWLNSMVQITKGSRMTISFHWHTDTKLGLHGCLLRLSRPDAPSQSYMVDAVFSKRGDAKVAVCIYACSQGLGQWIREVAAEIDARVTPAMRRRFTEEIFPAVEHSLNRIRHGLRPRFDFESDLATYNCVMTIDLSDGDDRSLRRQWSVPTAYKTKLDARIAVLCSAVDKGLMDFIKYRGKIPGEENDVVMVDADVDDMGKKRKRGKNNGTGEPGDNYDDENGQRKIAKTGAGVSYTKEEARVRGRFDGDYPGKRPFGDRQFNRPYSMNGRGRGFSRGGGYGFGPSNRRGGGRGGFSYPGPNRRPFPGAPQNMAFQSQATFHPSNFAPFGMHPQAQAAQFPFAPPAHGSGFHGATRYPSEYLSPNYVGAAVSAHDWRGDEFAGASIDGFMRAPPSAPQPVDSTRPGFHDHERDYGYPRERDYRQNHPHYAGAVSSPGSAGMSGGHVHQCLISPYESEYPNSNSNAVGLPGFGPGPYFDPVDFSYENEPHNGDGSENDGSRAHAYEEPDRYAPDYDRTPDSKPRNPFPTPPLSQAMQHSGDVPSVNPSNTPSSTQSGSPFQHRAPPTAPRADRLAAKKRIGIAGSPHYVHPNRNSLFPNCSPPTQPRPRRPSNSVHSRPPNSEQANDEQPLPYEDPTPQQTLTPATPAEGQKFILSSVEHLRPPRIERRRKPPTLEAGKQNAIDQKVDTVTANLEKEVVPMEDTEGFDEPTARGRRRNPPGAGLYGDEFSSKRGRSFDEASSRSSSAKRERSRSRSNSRPGMRNKSRDTPGRQSQSGRANSIPPPEERERPPPPRKTPTPSAPSPPPSEPATKKEKVSKTKKAVKKGKKADAVEESFEEGDDGNTGSRAELDTKTAEAGTKAKRNDKHETNGAGDKETNGSDQRQTNGTNKSERIKTGMAEANGTENGETYSAKQPQDTMTSRKRKDGLPPKSYLASLYEMCEKQSLPRPELSHVPKQVDEAANISDGFKVWLTMGNERLEHPLVFPTLEAGQERLAKSVLARLKGQVKKKKAEEL